MTASNAMNGKPLVKAETARRVLQAAAELGYRPNLAARQLSSGRTHVIGITISDFDLTFPADVAARLSDLAQSRGYQTVLQQTRYSTDFEQQVLSSAAMQMCDGIIVCWPSGTAAPIVEFSHAHPIVALDGFTLAGHVDCVFSPSLEGSAAAIRRFADCGRTRIAILGVAPSDAGTSTDRPNSAALRLDGALAAVHDCGLPPVADDGIAPCAWNRQGGYEAMSRLIRERRKGGAELDFDAVFCLTDPIAVGAMRALADAGIHVPEDVAVIGFDGLDEGAYCSPRLISVGVDAGEAARACLDMLIERIENIASEQPRSVTLDYHMLERASA